MVRAFFVDTKFIAASRHSTVDCPNHFPVRLFPSALKERSESPKFDSEQDMNSKIRTRSD